MSENILKYGSGDAAVMDLARRNFPKSGFNGLSFCCTPIELLANDESDKVISHASGFYWLHRGMPFLVTNWHVLAGRDFFTRESLSKMAYRPQKIRFRGLSVTTEQGLVRFDRPIVTMKWVDDECQLFNVPWEINGNMVDIVGLPIRSEYVFGRHPSRSGFQGSESLTCFINENTSMEISTTAGDDCFILGYPLNNFEGLTLPLWKRGTIASDTPIGVAGRPLFLVDASIGPAMSGSPIIRKVTNMVSQGVGIGVLQERSTYSVIGVYAGRLQSSDGMPTNIGYGWYKTLIDQLLETYEYGWKYFI